MSGMWQWDAAAFAASALGLAAIWLGYPMVVFVCASVQRRWRPARTAAGADGDHALPRVSVIVAAYNEAAHIVARLRNLQALEYPGSRMEILVSEDGSDDGTADLVSRMFPRVRLLSSTRRSGKAAAMNRAAAAARGEILVFTDANNSFTPATLRHLVAPFADPRVGAATGRKAVAASAGLGGGESLYWKYEGWLTRQESGCGGTVAGFGEALAIRRELYTALPTGVMLNDDLYLALQTLAQGKRVMAVAEARSQELGAAGARAEWERRNRMMVGRWQALASLRGQWRRLSPGQGLKVLFHEILRPISALWLGSALLTGMALLAAPAAAIRPAWLELAWLQAGVYGWVAAVGAARACGVRLGRAEAPYFFCLALGAALAGWWRYLRGSQSPLWRRAQRAQPPEITENPKTPGILHGLFWAASSFLAGKLLVLGSVMVLARLLVARQFGEVALALSAVTMLEIFGTLGLTSALIFEERDVEAAAQVCFRVTLAAAAVETALALAGAGRLARFFHTPQLAPMLRWLSSCLLLTALGNTHETLLRRRLAFRRKMIPDVAMAAVKGGLAIVLAELGCGGWSLIWSQIAGTAVCTLALWRVMPWRPRPGWNAAVARRLVAYSKHIYFLDGSSVILTNLDAFTIGRMLGAGLLGFYTLAFRVPEVALLSALNVITRVVFPAFSRLQSNLSSLRETLLATTQYTALATAPLAAMLVVLAPEIVRGFYGARWTAAIPVLRVLALCAGVRCLVHHFGDAYKAIGRPEVLTRVTWAWWALLPPSLILGARWGGLVGVAWGEVVTRVLMSSLHVFLAWRVLRIAPRALWHSFAPTFEATAVLSLALALIEPFCHALDPRLAAAALALLGAAMYFGWMYWRHPAVLETALRQMRWARPDPNPVARGAAVPAAEGVEL